MNIETNIIQRAPEVTSSATCNWHRILVVDDQPTIRNAFRRLIEIELPECKVDVAENGKEAIKHFLNEHEGILLMDLHMPVMDGQTAYYEIERICQGGSCQMPAVLFCTGYHPSKELRNIITGNSAHGLLLKPVTCKTLVSEIRKRMAA